METKKIAGLAISALALLVGPFILLSTSAMGCYQRKIDQKPDTESAKTWQLRLAGWCVTTGREKLGADMYTKFIDRFETDPRRPDAMWWRAEALKSAELPVEAKQAYRVLAVGYPDHQRGKDADQVLATYYKDYER